MKQYAIENMSIGVHTYEVPSVESLIYGLLKLLRLLTDFKMLLSAIKVTINSYLD